MFYGIIEGLSLLVNDFNKMIEEQCDFEDF